MLRLTLRTYKTSLLLFISIALYTGTLGAAQPAPQVLNISEVENAPATVGVSLDYPTVIEFDGLNIESVASSGRGQILAEVGGSTLSILANREDVDTEFTVSLIGGPTVRFNFVSNPDAASPTRYVVSSEPSSASTASVAEESAEAEAAEAEVLAAEAAEAAAEAQAEIAEAEAGAEASEAEAAEIAAALAEAQAAVAEARAAAEAAARAQAVAEAAAQAQAEAEAAAALSQAESGGELLSPLEAEALPPELEFRTSAYQPSPGSMVIQYILANNMQNLIAHDPQRLRIYADGETIPFEQVLPASGQSKRLSAGGNEYGEIFIPNVSADASDLVLEWELVEIGPGITYRASSNLIAALGEAPLPVPETVTAEADEATPSQSDAPSEPTATSPQASEPTPSQTDESTAESEAPAADTAAGSDTQPAQPAPQSAEVSAANEAEQLLPPEILAEIRRRGSDITVIGGSFDEPEMEITKEGAEVTGVSQLDTWSLYTRESAEANATVEGGEVCIDVSGESALFQVQDIGFGYAGFPLSRGRTYRLTFEAYADQPVFFRSLVGLAISPYSESFARVEALGTQPQTFFYTFEGRNDSDLNRVAFLLGGNQASSFRVCFDNIVLSEAGEVPEDAVSSSSE